MSNRQQDLLRRDADIALRTVEPRQKALVARRVGSFPIGLFAHRTYLECHGTPERLGDLSSHRLIGFDRDDLSYRSVGGLAAQLKREDFGFRCDSDLAQLAAARAGIGIAGCNTFVAGRPPGLVRVLEQEVAFKLDLWVVMHEDLKTTLRVRLLFDHLCARLSVLLKGQQG